MVKLTPELIEQCAQFTNPLRDRELDLRGYKIPVIENLGATLDQFDTIDMSDNDIRKLDGFPLLRRLKMILLNNNRIVRVAENLEAMLPQLDTLVMTNNAIQELGDIDNLSTIKSLRHISLLRNPVTSKKHYRFYIINKLPQVRVIDFRKVRLREKEQAAKLFKGKKGAKLSKELGKRSTKTFVPGAGLPAAKKAKVNGDKENGNPEPKAVARPDVEAIKNAIANASTLEEIERLNKLLQAGQIPGVNESTAPAAGAAGDGDGEVEMDT